MALRTATTTQESKDAAADAQAAETKRQAAAVAPSKPAQPKPKPAVQEPEPEVEEAEEYEDEQEEVAEQASKPVEQEPAPVDAEPAAEAATVAGEVQAKEVAPATSKEVAPATQAGTPAVAGGKAVNAAGQAAAQLADDGFEGLRIDGLSFERIKLSNGVFCLSQSGDEIGKEFQVVLQGSKAVHIIRRSDAQDEEQVYYSYDANGATTTDGQSADHILEEWIDAGYEPDAKTGLWPTTTYIEVMAVVIEMAGFEHLEGAIVLLQIPPASRAKFSGYLAVQKATKKLAPSQYVTRLKVGKTIQKDKNSYNPWVAEYVRLAEED